MTQKVTLALKYPAARGGDSLLFTNREWKASQTLPNYSVFVAFNLAATKDDWQRRIIESSQLVGAIKTEQPVVQTNWRFVPNWK